MTSRIADVVLAGVLHYCDCRREDDCMQLQHTQRITADAVCRKNAGRGVEVRIAERRTGARSSMPANSVYLNSLTSKTHHHVLCSLRLRDWEIERRLRWIRERSLAIDCVLAPGKTAQPEGVHFDQAFDGFDSSSTSLNEQEPVMSGINGDKSRFNRERKQKIARRIRNRELTKRLADTRPPASPASNAKPKTVSE